MWKNFSPATAVAFTLAAVIPAFAQAKEYTKADIIKFVEEASQFVKEKGKEAAVKEFNNKAGKFWREKGEIYIFAYDLKGINMCLPNNPEKIGKDYTALTDKNGVQFILKFVEIAKSAPGNFGKGEITYQWPNAAAGNKVQSKTSYIMGQGDWLIGAGIYVK